MFWKKRYINIVIHHGLFRLLVISLLLTFLAGCTNAIISNLPSPAIPPAGFDNPSSLPQKTAQSTITQGTSSTSILRSTSPEKPVGQSTPLPLSTTTGPSVASSTPKGNIKTVFIVMMENHNWSDIFNSPSAPYIIKTLLPQASYAQQYYNPSGNHPSEPNYLWLEAGTNYGVTNDDSPKNNHQSSTDHLVTYLDKAGFAWKAYQEGISGTVCPITSSGLYSPKHNPMVFFDNVTDNNNPNSGYCIAHERPYSELQADLQNNTVAQYNFITPNACNDMHSTDGCPSQDAVKNGDTWLSQQIPMIMGSKAYQQGGVIFITWDESENGDHPIGMIVLSPFAKGGGYSNTIHYTHSSTLKTIEEIFNLKPFLGDAVNATDLSDLFTKFP